LERTKKSGKTLGVISGKYEEETRSDVPAYEAARIHFGRSGRSGRVDVRRGILLRAVSDFAMSTGKENDGMETMPKPPR